MKIDDEKVNADGVNLLVSILVSYPEIGTLNFEPMNDSLKMTFFLKTIPEKKVFEQAKEHMIHSVLAYHMLEGLEKREMKIELHNYDNIAFITIIRDVESLSKGEFALVSTLMKESFAENLLADGGVTLGEEENIFQDDFIDNMIGNIKINHTPSKLIGIREEGRVMIFNK